MSKKPILGRVGFPTPFTTTLRRLKSSDMGYTKLFGCIVASTIWREDNATRLVWITMLAMKNERHIVEASLPGLADLARVSFTDCEAAIKKLESPDKYSRNQENEGRRIQKCEGGWLILNGEHYRKLMSAEERREYQKLYHRDYRAKKKQRKRRYTPQYRELQAKKDNGE